MPAEDAVCVLAAAGSGSRLGEEKPKALVELSGRSLLNWALSGLQESGRVSVVVVTAPAEHIDRFTEEVGRANLRVPVTVVAGGRSRQESVANGLEAAVALCERAGIELGPLTPTLVHDAARPLTPPELIASLVDQVAGGRSAVIPGLPVADTIKVVEAADGPARVVETPPRSLLRRVQTPQAFHWSLLLDVHERGRDLGADEAASATDDAGLAEMFGEEVWVVPGSEDALKVTTKEDLRQAEQLAVALSF